VPPVSTPTIRMRAVYAPSSALRVDRGASRSRYVPIA
jgi:hypothetical protein